MSNRNSPLWNASLAELIRASDKIAAHNDVLTRAISIVMARPFFMDCRRSDGDTFHNLVSDEHSQTATLTWSRAGVVARCQFPSFLLDLNDGALNEWRDRQRGLLASVRPMRATPAVDRNALDSWRGE